MDIGPWSLVLACHAQSDTSSLAPSLTYSTPSYSILLLKKEKQAAASHPEL